MPLPNTKMINTSILKDKPNKYVYVSVKVPGKFYFFHLRHSTLKSGLYGLSYRGVLLNGRPLPDFEQFNSANVGGHLSIRMT